MRIKKILASELRDRGRRGRERGGPIWRKGRQGRTKEDITVKPNQN